MSGGVLQARVLQSIHTKKKKTSFSQNSITENHLKILPIYSHLWPIKEAESLSTVHSVCQ